MQKELEKFEKGELDVDVDGNTTATNGHADASAGAAKKIALTNEATDNHVSAEAELKQETDAAADAAKDLKEASLEDAA